MERVTVSISSGLTEQLAGVKKPPEQQRKRKKPRSKADRDTVSYVQEHEEIHSALLRSRRVGKLLLKREDEELQKVEAQAQELVQKGAMQYPSSDACREHRAAVESCVQGAHPDGILHCTSLIDAYASCANRSFMAHLEKTTVQQRN